MGIRSWMACSANAEDPAVWTIPHVLSTVHSHRASIGCDSKSFTCEYCLKECAGRIFDSPQKTSQVSLKDIVQKPCKTIWTDGVGLSLSCQFGWMLIALHILEMCKQRNQRFSLFALNTGKDMKT